MILGITGTIGAGKGTVVDHLKRKGFAHYSVRDFLIEEIQKRDLPVDRDSMRTIANDIRAMHQPSYIIEMLYARAEAAGTNGLIESVRAIGEAEFLKAHGVKLVAVDADQKLRYERVVARGSVTDSIDFDTFVAQEEKELASTDPNGQNLIAVMRMADYRIENNGSMDELEQKTDEMIVALAG